MVIKNYLVILISFLVAISLSILPLPDWAIWLRPAWVLLVLCFWMLRSPGYMGIGIAWIVGLFLDALNGTVLGEHAFAFCIVAYLVTRMGSRLKYYPIWQQPIFILAVMLIYHLILFILQWNMGHMIRDWRFWLAPLIGALLWPWVSLLLERYQSRFAIR